MAQTADELGFASVWLSDQFHTFPQPAQEVTFECWAKMASTVDVLSHGRLTLGLGAGGWNEPQDHAYGYDAADASSRLRRLREAIQVMLSMWTQEEAVFEGEYYQVCGAINQPKGVQTPHIPLLIAGGGERVTLKLVAQYGDACHIGGDVPRIQQKLAILKQHCEAVGRDYESIHRTTTAFCSVGETHEQAMANIPEVFWGFLRNVGTTTLIGSPDTFREGLAAFEAAGIQEVLLLFPDALQLDSLRFFAKVFI